MRLWGLVHGHIPVRLDIEYTGDTWSQANIEENSGMAVVIPAQKIIDVLMTKRLVLDR